MLEMQEDGNLVLYNRNIALWSTGTSGSLNQLVMRPDGNLVVFDNMNKQVCWEAGTRGEGNYMVLGDDANLAVYDENGNELWSSRSRLSRF